MGFGGRILRSDEKLASACGAIRLTTSLPGGQIDTAGAVICRMKVSMPSLGGMVAVRCPSEYEPLMQRAGGCGSLDHVAG